MDWSEPVTARLHYITFPLRVEGLDFQLPRMLGPLARIDLDGAIYDIMTLDDEETRGQCLAVLASFILDRKAPRN
jgi:hypothetical protein